MIGVTTIEGLTLSAEQVAIGDWCETGIGHAVVEAYAGTGKTSTIVGALARVSAETRIAVLVFNKKNEIELSQRVAHPAAECFTFNGCGNRTLGRFWERVRIADPVSRRADSLTEVVCGPRVPDVIKRLVSRLHTKGRELAPFAEGPAELEGLAVQWDCVPDAEWEGDGFGLSYVCDRAYAAMVEAVRVKPTTGIDFVDQVYVPLRLRMFRPAFGLVVVDERQDMNGAQLALARAILAPGGRLLMVGDVNQAIYAFRGADAAAVLKVQAELGAVTFPLSTTYRCSRAVVAAAQRFVPGYRAADGAVEGSVETIGAAEFRAAVTPGDAVLSRKNAPLVAVALSLVRAGVACKIEGRDLGAGLSAIARKLATGAARDSVPAWLGKLTAWRDREVERCERANQLGKADLVLDQFDTLTALADGVASVGEIDARIGRLFAKVEGTAGPAVVVCSSIHRAKGLEWPRVFILAETLGAAIPCEGCRHRHGRAAGGGCGRCGCQSYSPDPIAVREEQNLEYVAITRARVDLRMVVGIGK